eukprot:SAG11_NODE_6294_length_1343_cov_1.311093_2_plen_176_part_01
MECANCTGTSSRLAVDQPGGAVCQLAYQEHPGANKDILFNLGMQNTATWGDGPVAEKSVTLTYEHGSRRGGCDVDRSTEIVVTCDPCNNHNISKVSEPSKCTYRVEVSSFTGCATNHPPPAGMCPHICDTSTMTCKAVPAGTAGANATLGDCRKSCTKAPPPPPPPPLSQNPCIRF